MVYARYPYTELYLSAMSEYGDGFNQLLSHAGPGNIILNMSLIHQMIDISSKNAFLLPFTVIREMVPASRPLEPTTFSLPIQSGVYRDTMYTGENGLSLLATFEGKPIEFTELEDSCAILIATMVLMNDWKDSHLPELPNSIVLQSALTSMLLYDQRVKIDLAELVELIVQNSFSTLVARITGASENEDIDILLEWYRAVGELATFEEVESYYLAHVDPVLEAKMQERAENILLRGSGLRFYAPPLHVRTLVSKIQGGKTMFRGLARDTAAVVPSVEVSSALAAQWMSLLVLV